MFRNQASKEALSTANGHSHRSTGIASGLEYRDGYAVGGRVGLSHGGPPPHPEDVLDINPDLNKIFERAQEKAGVLQIDTPDFMSLAVDRTPLARDYSQDKLDYSQYAVDYDKFKPTAFEPIGTAATRTLDELSQPVPGRTLGERSEVATFIKNLGEESAAFKGTRRELDMLKEEQDKKIKELSDTQAVELSRLTDQSKQQMELLNLNESQELKAKTLQGILDSDIANKETVASLYQTGIDAFLENKKIKLDALSPGSLSQGELFLQVVKNPNSTSDEIFQTMDAFDIAGGYSKFRVNAISDFDKLYKERRQTVPGGSRKQKDIIPVPGSSGYEAYEKERDAYVADRLNNLIGSDSAYSGTGISFAPDLTLAQDNIRNEFVPSFEGLEIDNNMKLQAVIQAASVADAQTRSAVINVFNLMERLKLPQTDPNRMFKGLDGELPTPRPIIQGDIDEMIAAYKAGGATFPPIDLKPYLELYKETRSAFAMGGAVTSTTNAPLELDYNQMRKAFSPQQISNFDLKEIVKSKEMSVDFSRIKDRIDLDEFNDKYQTEIILPLV